MKTTGRTLGYAAVSIALAAGAFLFLSGRLRIETGEESPEQERKEEAGREAGGEEASRSHVERGGVVLTEEEAKLAGVKAEPAGEGSVAVTLSAPGEVRLADGHWARVASRLAGVLGEVKLAVGDEVAVGDVLATVKSPELAESSAARAEAVAELAIANRNRERWKALAAASFASKSGTPSAGWVELDQALADLDAAAAEESLAEKTRGRTQDLFDKGIKTQSEVFSAEQDQARSKIRLESARRRLDVLGVAAATEVERATLKSGASAAKLRALGLTDAEVEAVSGAGSRTGEGLLTIRSPLAGVVIERDAASGESVAADKALYLVADPSTVWVQVSLNETDAARVREGMPVTVRAAAYPAAAIPGRVSRTGSSVDERTRTLGLRVEIENASAAGADVPHPLRRGMFVTADVEVARSKDVLVVPQAAVQHVGGEDTVFVQVGESAGKEAAEPIEGNERGGEKEPEGKEGKAPAGMDDKEPGGRKEKEREAREPKTRFEPRHVKLGVRDGKVVEILSGLRAGDLVVTEGAGQLRAELLKSQFGEED